MTEKKMQRRAREMRVRRMTFAGLYLALALVLPFLTGQIPEIGAMLCPMHIPALLCGFVCGWNWGMAVGFVAPLLRSVLFGMPKLYPSAVAMAFELAAYGVAAGLLQRVLPDFPGKQYPVLVGAMVAGRLVWGAAQAVLLGLSGTVFSLELFLAGAVLNAVPGIILHLVVIPPLVMLMERTGLSLNSGRSRA